MNTNSLWERHLEILLYFREEKASTWPEATAAFDAAIAAVVELGDVKADLARLTTRATDVIGHLLTAAEDCNEWLCRTDRAGTAHQQQLAAAIAKATQP